MTSAVNYYAAVVYPGCWHRYWCESYEPVKDRFDFWMSTHPGAIGSIVRLRLKVKTGAVPD